MQTQTNFSNQLMLAAAPAGGLVSGQPVMAGDVLGISKDSYAEDARAVLATNGQHGMTQVIAKEAWQTGARVFWHETAQLFTTRQTHWPIGRAGEDKPADLGFGVVQLDGPHRLPDEVIAPFVYEQMPTLGARAVYVLRDFGGPVILVSLEIVSSQLTPGNARIMLGDGTGNSDQIVSSRPVSELTGYDDAEALGATLSGPIERLALRITTADIAGGYLSIRAGFTRIA